MLGAVAAECAAGLFLMLACYRRIDLSVVKTINR
jgi:NADH:ubiquinone oxidoreductase subunit K